MGWFGLALDILYVGCRPNPARAWWKIVALRVIRPF
jgi:hypothetical protein